MQSKGVWKDALERVEEYAEKYKRINVIMGPIFDYNADGLGDSIEEIERFELLFLYNKLLVVSAWIII